MLYEISHLSYLGFDYQQGDIIILISDSLLNLKGNSNRKKDLLVSENTNSSNNDEFFKKCDFDS